MAIVRDIFSGTYSHLTCDGGRVHITEECTHLIPHSVNSVCVCLVQCVVLGRNTTACEMVCWNECSLYSPNQCG